MNMNLDFIRNLCEKIELPPEAQEVAFHTLLTQEKEIRRAQKRAGMTHLSACFRRLRRDRVSGAAFCLAFSLAEAERAYARYRHLGIPDTVFYDTMRDISVWVKTAEREENIVGLCELSWIRQSLYLNLFRIGRLQYQFFKTNHLASGLSLTQCRAAPIKSGALVLNMHIPQDGRLELAACRDSLAAARVFFKEFFPQYDYQGFVCDSWLLDPYNARFMRADSNILRFSSLFDCVMRTNVKNSEIVRRLWGKHTAKHAEISDFPEKTDLQKRAKAYLLRGGETGNGYGFISK